MRLAKILLLTLVVLCLGYSYTSDTGVGLQFPLNNSGTQDVNLGGTATACLWFDDTVAGTYTDECGGLTFTVGGAPTRVSDWTQPAGLGGTNGYAYLCDGTNDYLYRADDGTFDPSGSFSVVAVATPDSVTGSDSILGKGSLATTGWHLYRSTTSMVFKVCKGGGSCTSVTRSSAAAISRPLYVTATYQYVADGSSVMNIYVDNLATVSDTSAVGPPEDVADELAVGSDTGASYRWEGILQYINIKVGSVMTEAEHDQGFAQWQGRQSTSRTQYVSVASAAPPHIVAADPASGVEPFFIPSPANSLVVAEIADGSGGMYGASAITNVINRSAVCESQDGSNHPSGWITAETAGDGSAAVDCSTTHMADGRYSVKFVLTGTTSGGTINSPCTTTGIGSDTRFCAYVMCSSGTCQDRFRVIEYDAADCSSLLGTTVLYNDNPGTNWAWKCFTHAAGSWNGATSSYRMELTEQGDGGVTSYWDSTLVYVGANAIDHGCFCDADAACVCNHVIATGNSPLSANGMSQIEMIARAPYAGTSLSGQIIFYSDGQRSTANTYNLGLNNATDEPFFVHYDYNSDYKTCSPNVLNWAADTDYTIKGRSTGDGNVYIYWNGSWSGSTSGSGLGIRNASQSSFYVGGQENGGKDVYVRDLVFLRRMR